MITRMLDVSACATEADEYASLAIYNAAWPHDAVSMAEVHSFKSAMIDYVDLLARVGVAPAGSAIATIPPQRRDLVFALVTVSAEHRRRGVGTVLYTALSDWARERGLSEVEVPVRDDDPESLAFAERRGFREERRERGVVLRLREVEPPPVELPEGLEIVTWADRPELARGIYEVAVEATPDIPGLADDELEPFDDWLAHDMLGAGDKPEATFVALAGDEVVGYAKFSLTDAQPATAHHDLTGVKRAWRGRGVARALKATQIAWAKENGYEELHTRNDARNAPIRRLNERFGYRPAIGRIYLRGPVLPSN